MLACVLLQYCSSTPKQESSQALVSELKQEREIWSKEIANNWYKEQPWLVGSNFNPSTSINQLEMWQGEVIWVFPYPPKRPPIGLR